MTISQDRHATSQNEVFSSGGWHILTAQACFNFLLEGVGQAITQSKHSMPVRLPLS